MNTPSPRRRLTVNESRLLVSPMGLHFEIQRGAVSVLDCTVEMLPLEVGGFKYISGAHSWNQRCIPTSQHVDLLGELGCERDGLRFMMPEARDVAAILQTKGVDPASDVILYSNTGPHWAARVYWTLHAMGLTRVHLLDGDLIAWEKHGLPIQKGTPAVPLDELPNLNFNEHMIADASTVLAALNDADTVVLSALAKDVHSGEKLMPSYKRRGRIPGSKNLPGVNLWNSEEHRFSSVGYIRASLAETGAMDAAEVITYCGGGVLASTLAFALDLVGAKNARVYDGSMTEWGPNVSLPLEVDQEWDTSGS